MTTRWQDLAVFNDEQEHCGTLEEYLADGSGIESIVLDEQGEIDEWEQHFICAENEEPSWDTPLQPVDWTGFADALAKLQEPKA